MEAKKMHDAVKYLMEAGINEEEIEKMSKMGYFRAPASVRHHLNVDGGLAEHSMNVVDMMLELRAFDEPRSCYRVGMLHDLVKCTCYRKIEGEWKHEAPTIPGHGTASAILAASIGISLTEAEREAIIWHMGSFNLLDSERESYYTALQKNPRELVLTHAADHIASIMETGERK